MGEFNIRASYSQIDNAQRAQQVQHAESEAQQRQVAGQVTRQSYENDHQVVSSHRAEKDRVRAKRDGEGGGNAAGGDPREKKKKDRPRDDDHVIDVQV